MSIRVVLKPPVTPPYLLLLFYAICSLSGCLDLFADSLRSGGAALPVLAGVPRVALALVSLWIGGTFPLETVLPATNVAHEKDVRVLSIRVTESASQRFLVSRIDPVKRPDYA